MPSLISAACRHSTVGPLLPIVTDRSVMTQPSSSAPPAVTSSPGTVVSPAESVVTTESVVMTSVVVSATEPGVDVGAAATEDGLSSPPNNAVPPITMVATTATDTRPRKSWDLIVRRV